MATLCCGKCERRLEGVPESGAEREAFLEAHDWWEDRWCTPPRPPSCPHCGGLRNYVGTACMCCGETIVELPEDHPDRGEAAREQAETWCYATAFVMDIVEPDQDCRAGVVCWQCFRKNRNDVDMWIDRAIWEAWGSVIPYERLPILDHENEDASRVYAPLS